MIAGTHSGVGKTTITLGLMAILSAKGYNVQGFKAGPDYIDAGHHYAATNNPSRNLDTWLMSDDACKELFHRSASMAQISIIEGVMGLYDGCLDKEGKGSSAYLARILNAPVILVIDARGMAQSAGAVALGFKQFDMVAKIQGIILNQIGSERHFNTIKSSIEDKAHIPVLGYLSKNRDFIIPERHLGLMSAIERGKASNLYKGSLDRGIERAMPFTGGKLGYLYQRMGEEIDGSVDVDKVLEIAFTAGEFPPYQGVIFPVNVNGCISKGIDNPTICSSKYHSLRIAVAMDEAFHFYYHDNLDLLKALGAEICYFSPLYDTKLPSQINGIYIGGGFPELFGQELEANEGMRNTIRDAARYGVVIYAECGGMMYLLDKLIDFNGRSYKMSGVFSAGSIMENKRQGLGYIIIEAQSDNIICKKGDVFKAHEFHWSSIKEKGGDLPFVFKVSKGDSNARFDGLFARNVLASYSHIHFASDSRLAINLLESMNNGPEV